MSLSCCQAQEGGARPLRLRPGPGLPVQKRYPTPHFIPRLAMNGFQRMNIAIRRSEYCVMSVMRHNPLEPGSIQTVELERRDGILDALHISSGKRDQVGITIHKADPAAICDDLDDIT